MAVIVLDGADFSQNNIGQIDIKVPFLDATKGILSRYGISVNEDDSFQKAFNKFVSNLVTAGVYQKIKNLCLPFMANVSKNGDLTYAQINALDGENFFVENISESLELVNNGLKPIIGANVVTANLLDYVNPISMHYGAYNSTPEIRTTKVKTIFADTGKVIWLTKWGSLNTPELWVNNPTRIYGDTNYKAASCLILGNMTAARSTLVVNGQVGEKSPTTFESSNANNPRLFEYRQGSQDVVYHSEETTSDAYAASVASWSLLTIGDALTDEESIAYNNAVNALMAAVNEYL